MAERRAPGWYDDEADASALRYWDGRGWTPHTVPKPVESTPVESTPVESAPVESAPVESAPVESTPVEEPAAPPAPPAAIAPDTAGAPGAAIAPEHEHGAGGADPVLAALVAASEDDDAHVTRTIRFVPEHTTVPTPTDRPAASVSVYGLAPAHPRDDLSVGQVALLVLASLAAGTLTIAIASAIAMTLLG